uniref:Group-specific protein n=1 Tax=Pseudomonas phage RVTF4 TaxID=3236931 RepID=A0AB39CCP0_9VIRU
MILPILLKVGAVLMFVCIAAMLLMMTFDKTKHIKITMAGLILSGCFMLLICFFGLADNLMDLKKISQDTKDHYWEQYCAGNVK